MDLIKIESFVQLVNWLEGLRNAWQHVRNAAQKGVRSSLSSCSNSPSKDNIKDNIKEDIRTIKAQIGEIAKIVQGLAEGKTTEKTKLLYAKATRSREDRVAPMLARRACEIIIMLGSKDTT
jgi:hypothetical protein